MDEMELTNNTIDNLIDALNASGVPFARDVWYDENNQLDGKDYGVVELTGAPVSLWGDDGLVEQNIRGNVVLYVHDGNDGTAKAVQDILKAQDIGFQLTGTSYLTVQRLTRWIWRFDMSVYLNGETASN